MVEGDLNLGGTGTFVVANNAEIEIYVGGSSLSIYGNAIVNKDGLAENLIIYADKSVTSVNLSGNGQFTGVLVAPDAHIDMNGAGSDPVDFVGALVVSSVKMNGHFRFHYDEALGRMPSKGRYLITSWDELYNY